ncbi:hypothetical protein QR90_16490 [Deinococcus radiopugnans]|uniref:Uncharacterized protein n=2 Tax=Deinococcus radiopugnans TaxID=57497 RepID=A0A0A7KPX3_9DEIO|nr:hypothetical protein [Deinococcus radiopugnans]AIZ46768.1 hypothetical protein QR90_16490 [Deinococcus radiopugnans]MBB6016356.1 hypothetical protein [Deinococcus radiopugnans ATCC 19172]QLG12268.1 hypothetical protein HLB42_16840 [Deinococcus sp. D7000]TNM71321.1 hypothetical protein FHR04_09090 [Deinococcus radiopugnans ATCC 19172]
MKLNPDLLRPLLGTIGLMIGFGVYAVAGDLPQPWQRLSIGLMFVLLGVSAVIYAKGERWIQVLGGVLLLYGALRMFLIG